MFTITLAVALAIAIVAIGFLTKALLHERYLKGLHIQVAVLTHDENVALRKRLERRTERHQRASSHLVTQRAQLREKEAELARAGIWIQYFFKILDSSGVKIDDIHITRKEARSLFVA
jgi:hypothetical protein